MEFEPKSSRVEGFQFKCDVPELNACKGEWFVQWDDDYEILTDREMFERYKVAGVPDGPDDVDDKPLSRFPIYYKYTPQVGQYPWLDTYVTCKTSGAYKSNCTVS